MQCQGTQRHHGFQSVPCWGAWNTSQTWHTQICISPAFVDMDENWCRLHHRLSKSQQTLRWMLMKSEVHRVAGWWRPGSTSDMLTKRYSLGPRGSYIIHRQTLSTWFWSDLQLQSHHKPDTHVHFIPFYTDVDWHNLCHKTPDHLVPKLPANLKLRAVNNHR